MPNFLVKLVLVVFVMTSADAKAFDWFPESATTAAEQACGYGD